jgi:cation diffusion facilitator family transporter
MPSLFSRFFRHIPRPEARAILVSLGVGIAMLGVKFLAYYYTRSAAILSDALEGIVNIAAAGFATFALSTAHRPADVDHPYGHGKIEFLSAAFEGGMIILAALLIFGESALEIWRIHRGANTVVQLNLDFGVLLVAVAMAVHGVLGGYLIQAGKRVESMTLEADGWHLLSDAATSAAALVALLVVKMTGWLYADPLGALVIGLYITHTGYKLLRRSAAGLMDEQDFSDQKLLISILDAHVGPDGKEPRICSYHKLRHRHSGRYHWVDFHLMVPNTWDIQRGHAVASAIEYEIEQALRSGNATAHIEPCVQPDCPNCAAQGVQPVVH